MVITSDGLRSYWHLGFSLLGILKWSQILTCLSFRTQTFHHGYIHAFYHTRAWPSLSFTLHIPPWHMTSPFSRLGGDVDQSSIALVMFSYVLLDFRFNIFHDSRAWQIVDLLVTMLSLWQLACWVLFCLLFAFWALIIIVVIHQLVLFCQHGVTIHGPVWHYLSEVGHFHCMMDEHISEYSSFETLYILVCLLSYWGIPLLWDHQTFHSFHSPSDLVVDPESCILGHTLLLRDHRTFHRLHYLST